MTQLATITRNGASAPPALPHLAQAFSVNDLWEMACWVVKGGLFPDLKTPEAAISLMLLCQADGLHPVHAMRRYHVIFGRFSMRADAIQAEFQARGGKIKLVERSAKRAAAFFSHPVHQPEPVELEYTYQDAEKAGDAGKNDLYKKRPAAMLWARLVSMAVTTIDPGVKVGTMAVEELQDVIAAELPAVQIAESREQARAAVASADEPVPGHDPRQPDTRPYVLMANEAVAATNELVTLNWGELPDPPAPLDAKRLHGVLALKAVNTGKAEGPAPTKVQAAVAFVSKVYTTDRQWVRSEVRQACQEHAEAAAEALRAAREADVEPDVQGPLSDEDAAELAGIEEPGAEG